ncbi:hypothetical protein B4144_4332 [Bacillus atrophaeus]|nr:hypothetical protein B4144_4332 [Bacillus atrophaeus]
MEDTALRKNQIWSSVHKREKKRVDDPAFLLQTRVNPIIYMSKCYLS